MAITNYSELKTAVASFLHRTDVTSEIDDFIDLAESDMQVRAKLAQWDTSATVTFVSGTASLPADFVAAKALKYPAGDYTLEFRPQGGFDEAAAADTSGEPAWYTIRGSQIIIYPQYSGDMTLVYTARFTPLSDSTTTNSLLTLFPDAYLYGSLAHACYWTQDKENASVNQALFNAALNRIQTYMTEYKFGNDLIVRVA